ncbi:bifunctional tetrahydrofolate synthase/dihydrofolate synthase [Arsenophonus symbiont of Ornithomya chloropus]|uniref:bifunctional tetrahydrofolate synthase/dihydrofolate synthase n=1 Tax=Arsenophonus symbiont of Ornithomya chloropus TaxID=634121 RepID=UPI0032B2B5C6
MKNFIIPNVNSSLDTWLNYLNNQHKKMVDMSIDRINIVAHNLDLLNPAPKIITVSGTNGKGTTCHILESILIETGLRVGVYSSPHLINYTERVRIQGHTLPEIEFCRVFSDIESKRDNTTLTYFEYGTLAALQLFKKAKLDLVILEVGLGGLFDATNIIDSTISVITNIALDHLNWFGHDRENIGYEKAGIFRKGKYAVIGELNIPKSIKKVADTLGTKLFCYGIDWQFKKEKNQWAWESVNHNFQQLPLPNVPLINAATGLAILSCLMKESKHIANTISLKAINKGLINAKLPGRLQVISHQPYVILDVAHNPHAANYLAKKVSQLPRKKNTKVYAVVGMLIDKDIKGTLSCLNTQVDKWYLASLNVSRGASAEQLAKYVQSPSKFNTVKNAWLQVMLEATKKDIIIVYGSFHTVSEVLILKNRTLKNNET